MWVCAPHILAVATIWGQRLLRPELPIVQLLFEGGEPCIMTVEKGYTIFMQIKCVIQSSISSETLWVDQTWSKLPLINYGLMAWYSCPSQFILWQERRSRTTFRSKSYPINVLKDFVAAAATVYQEAHFMTGLRTEGQEFFAFCFHQHKQIQVWIHCNT